METYRLLAASRRYVLEHAYETVFVLCRATGQRTAVAFHHGDPVCGIIAPDETWFATAGEGVAVFRFDGGSTTYLRDGGTPWHVSAMRLEGSDTLRFLVDPWSDQASVWQLHPGTRHLVKLRDGPYLRDQPYRETVDY